MKLAALLIAGSCVAGFVAPAAANPLGGDAGSGVKADRIVVKKTERRLYLLAGDTVVRSYQVSLGRNPEGQKYFSGDGRTPEGLYYIEYKNPGSQFYRSLKISYPSGQDIAKAREWGLSPGGLIMIHGQPTNRANGAVESRSADWTEGCIAVSNDEMDEIWWAVDAGTPIEIQP